MTTWGLDQTDGKLQPNKHITYGNDDYRAPMSFHYMAPVSDMAIDFFTRAVEVKYGGHAKVENIGAIYDYARACVEDYAERSIGHYRLKINGEDKIFVVVDKNPEQFLEAAADYVDALDNADIPIVKAVRNQQGKFVDEIEYGERKTLFVYEESYPTGNPDWMIQTGIDGGTFELGQLIGKIHTASVDYVMYQTLHHSDKLQGMKDFMDEYKMTPMRNLYEQEKRGLESHAQAFLDRFFDSREQWIPSTGNFIEKQPLGVVALAHDSATQGYMPMMTDNACYDCGLAVARIVTNPVLYKFGSTVKDGLEGFIEGYNQKTGYALTINEAFEAAENAFTIVGVYGRTLAARGDYKNTLDEHIKSVLQPHRDRFSRIREEIQPKSSKVSSNFQP